MIIFQLAVYRLKRWYHFIKTGLLRGLVGELQYGYPARKLKIYAITGTDGKTSSCTMLYHVLKAAGKKVALVTTVAAYIGDDEIDTGFHVTTPDAGEVQRFLAKMVELGIEYVVLEATSHGLYQHRLWGIAPKVAGLTNITHEHLDYHITYPDYVAAKALLFQAAGLAIINEDDSLSYRELKKRLADHPQLQTYSRQQALPAKISKAIKQRFPESYNQQNARLVYAMAQPAGVSDADFIQGIQHFPGVAGRMQKVGSAKGVQVIIDFAHTPNSLQSALTAIRQELRTAKTRGRLIAVFGCAGLRDVQKRPMMGRIAAELADLVVMTAEDPRTEDVWAIIRQMKSQLGSLHAKVSSVADRRAAIEFAILKLAKPGDVVGIFGKGHEKSMSYGKVEYPWSDLTVAQETLAKLRTKKKE